MQIYGIKQRDIIILHPSSRITPLQSKQKKNKEAERKIMCNERE
jgi:hypothetical protein